MALEGMDVDAIKPSIHHHAEQRGLQELETLIGSTTTGRTRRSSRAGWGRTHNTFHSQWPSFTSALNSAHVQLTTLHQHLQTNFSAQQGASQGY